MFEVIPGKPLFKVVGGSCNHEGGSAYVEGKREGHLVCSSCKYCLLCGRSWDQVRIDVHEWSPIVYK